MQIFLAAFGSFGDIQPFLWLGKMLRAQCHEIVFIANPFFQDSVEKAGFDFYPAGTVEDYHAAARPAVLNGSSFHDQGEQITAAKRLFSCMFLQPVAETCRIICEKATPDALVIGHNFAYGARLAAEKCRLRFLNVPLSTYWLRGFRQTRGWRDAWAMKLLDLNSRFIDGQVFTRQFNAIRAAHGLEPMKTSSSRYMQESFNLCLFPEWWLDFPLQHGLRTAFIGFPTDPAEREAGGALPDELPADLAVFLAKHEQPLVFTPGSAAQDHAAFFQAALTALQKLGRPGIFLTRSPEDLPVNLPEQVIHCDFVPLGLLLGRCAALVHHGGIGTSAQALLAGLPQLVCCRLDEQKENARQLVRLGVGRALPYAGITGEAMTPALECLLQDEAVPVNCRQVRDRLAEDARRHPPAELLALALAAVSKPDYNRVTIRLPDS